MTLSTKILITLFAVFFVMTVGFVVYKEYSYKSQIQALTDQLASQKQLADNITRSLSTYATKQDMDNFAKANDVNLDTIQKDLSTLNASLVAMNKISVNSNGQVANNLPSTSTKPTANPSATPTVECNGQQIPCPNADPYGYAKNVQTLHLDEQFTNKTTIPIGDVNFDASNAKPWGVNVLPRTYNSVTTLGVDENQHYTAYNNFSITTGGKTYPVQVSNAQLIQQAPSAHFTFQPRLYLGVDGGVTIAPLQGEVTPNISVGVIGYGAYKTQPDLSILQVGVGYGGVSKNVQFTLMPISYNVGKLAAPWLSNVYLGPTASVDVQGHFTVGAGIRVGL